LLVRTRAPATAMNESMLCTTGPLAPCGMTESCVSQRPKNSLRSWTPWCSKSASVGRTLRRCVAAPVAAAPATAPVAVAAAAADVTLVTAVVSAEADSTESDDAKSSSSAAKSYVNSLVCAVTSEASSEGTWCWCCCWCWCWCWCCRSAWTTTTHSCSLDIVCFGCT